MTARIKSLQGRVEYASLELNIRQTPSKPILGPLGYTFHGVYWVVEKLFVIRPADSSDGSLPAYVPTGTTSPKPAGSEPALLQYSVQEGDTIDGISRLFVTSPDDIRRVNPTLQDREVTPGEMILIPASSR